MVGYIYLRFHNSYLLYNAYKMGKTTNIPDRDNQYSTGEIKRGYFILVFEVPYKQLDIIERLLQNYFKDLNIRFDAGIEFYNIKIIDLIEPYLTKLNIKFRKLSIDEINKLIRRDRLKKLFKNNIKVNKQLLTPRKDQIITIEKSLKYFKEFDKGILVLTCGVGKTLISLWVSLSLKVNSIIIGVPNILLLQQWEKAIKLIFINTPHLIVKSGIEIKDITNFLRDNKKAIIITTYSSCNKVFNASEELSYIFDMKILDEVHHLTTVNMNLTDTLKKYIQMLKIKSSKQLSLTATLKYIENTYDSKNIISNDNIEIFGEIIDRKNLNWAIINKIVSDYEILTIILSNDNDDIDKILLKFNIDDDTDKRLFLSAYISLKSIKQNNSHHLLIYSNNKINSSKIIYYIKLLIEYNYFSDIYYSCYHSDMNSREQKAIINNFTISKSAIISCVYCLGEGWDFPILDAVLFSENMTSTIRIVQSALRASRKNINEPNKKAKIILPLISDKNDEEWLDINNQDYKKIKEVIYQMSLEDESIISKIKVIKIDINEINNNGTIRDVSNVREREQGFGEYDNELTEKLKIKIINRKDLFNITYEKAKKIISDKNIKCKEDYYKLCDIDIRLSKEPELLYKGKFTNWIEYLNIKRSYYELNECKNKIDEYFKIYPELKKVHIDLYDICEKLCELDNLFPPKCLWLDYYNISNLNAIIIINTNNNKKMIKFNI